MVEASTVLKVAKKSLKRQDSKSMKVKALVKLIVKEMESRSTSSNNNVVDAKMIKKWIQDSSKFNVDGKIVSLSSKKQKKEKGGIKRSISPLTVVTKKARLSDNEEDDQQSTSASTSCTSDSLTKKKEKKKEKDSDDVTMEDVIQWRKENKIMVKNATDNTELDNALTSNPSYFPYISFESTECQTEIAVPLLKQCTEGNGFTKPSPIQAQSWPILLSHKKANIPPRDMVGIAETGSGKTLGMFNKKAHFPRSVPAKFYISARNEFCLFQSLCVCVLFFSHN